MTPSFPRWMRSIDPLLQGEDTNELYQLFLYRRREHPRGRMWILGGLRPVIVAKYLAAAAMLGIAAWFLITDGNYLFFLLPLVGIPAIRFLGARSRLDSERLPRRASHVYTPNGTHVRAATDLWLAGYHGSQIAEAIYLEARKLQIYLSLLACALITIVPLFLYLRHYRPAGIWYIFTGGLYLFFAYQAFLLVNLFIMRHGARHIKDLIQAWEGTFEPFAVFAREAARYLIIFVCIEILLCGLGAMLLGFRGGPGELIAGAIYGSFGLYIKSRIDDWTEALRNSARQTFSDAGMAYAIFLGRDILGDPLGPSWARWYYNPARHLRDEEKSEEEEKSGEGL